MKILEVNPKITHEGIPAKMQETLLETSFEEYPNSKEFPERISRENSETIPEKYKKSP